MDPGEKGVEVGGVETVAGRVDAAQIVTRVPLDGQKQGLKCGLHKDFLNETFGFGTVERPALPQLLSALRNQEKRRERKQKKVVQRKKTREKAWFWQNRLKCSNLMGLVQTNGGVGLARTRRVRCVSRAIISRIMRGNLQSGTEHCPHVFAKSTA
jgi:hypothetical protein